MRRRLHAPARRRHQELALEPHGVTCSVAVAVAAVGGAHDLEAELDVPGTSARPGAWQWNSSPIAAAMTSTAPTCSRSAGGAGGDLEETRHRRAAAER
jgi:hypothetical protein